MSAPYYGRSNYLGDDISNIGDHSSSGITEEQFNKAQKRLKSLERKFKKLDKLIDVLNELFVDEQVKKKKVKKGKYTSAGAHPSTNKDVANELIDTADKLKELARELIEDD